MAEQSSFRFEIIPKADLKNLNENGENVRVSPKEQPAIPGCWENRYCSLSASFLPVLERVFQFEVREDDVWIVTSAKCGTTWAQEMTWLLLNNLDYETAKSVDITLRSPFLEFNGVVENVPHDTINAADKLKSPRLIKSHLPAFLLPKQLWGKKPKIIYVFRNPKDAAVSYYHHWRGMVGYKGSKEDFLDVYMDGHVNFNPFWEHVLDFWNLRNEPNIFFTSYEQMKQNLGAVIKSVSLFINRPIDDDNIPELIDHLSFDKMKQNPACNHEKEFESIKNAAGIETHSFRFVRRGVVGSHKDEMTKDIINKFDLWTENNLKKHNLSIEILTSFKK